jgi:hypothetical protein
VRALYVRRRDWHHLGDELGVVATPAFLPAALRDFTIHDSQTRRVDLRCVARREPVHSDLPAFVRHLVAAFHHRAFRVGRAYPQRRTRRPIQPLPALLFGVGWLR